jgi:hypothetical protein
VVLDEGQDLPDGPGGLVGIDRPGFHRCHEGDVPAGLSIDAQTGRVRWQVPESYLPDTTLQQTFELTIVAEEIVTGTQVAETTTQVVEITVVDRLADLVAATLTLAATAISDPLAGPTTVSLVSTTSDSALETKAALEMAGTFDDPGFFGTQFGPTGVGGVEESDNSESGAEADPNAPEETEQSSLERLLNEISGEIGEAAVEALVTATQAQADEVPAEPPVEEQAPEVVPVKSEKPSEEIVSEVAAATDPPETASLAEQASESELASEEVAAAKSAES